MSAKPKFKRGGKGLYCENMKELITEANIKGFSDLDIAKEVGVDRSTVRNWWRRNRGDKEKAIKLYTFVSGEAYIGSLESENSSEPSAQDRDRVAEIVRWFEEGKRLGVISASFTLPIKF